MLKWLDDYSVIVVLFLYHCNTHPVDKHEKTL